MFAPVVVLIEALSAATSLAVAFTPVTVTNSRPVPFAGRTGTCEATGRSYNLHRLMILENRTIEIEGDGGPVRVSIDGEYVQIHTAGENSREIFATNIADIVDPHSDLDIELKLGYFDGHLVIFWKETFQHRVYQQGMFRVEGHFLTRLCNGRGGVTSR